MCTSANGQKIIGGEMTCAAPAMTTANRFTAAASATSGRPACRGPEAGVHAFDSRINE